MFLRPLMVSFMNMFSLISIHLSNLRMRYLVLHWYLSISWRFHPMCRILDIPSIKKIPVYKDVIGITLGHPSVDICLKGLRHHDCCIYIYTIVPNQPSATTTLTILLAALRESYMYCATAIKQTTIQWRYNAVNFLQNPHNRHSLARPWGRDMGCLFWVQSLIYVLTLPSQCRLWYLDKLDRIIATLQCVHRYYEVGSPLVSYLFVDLPSCNFL